MPAVGPRLAPRAACEFGGIAKRGQTTGALHRIAIIPRDVGRAFVDRDSRAALPTDSGRSIRCLHVSNAAMYKHQWEVVRAISLLRSRGFNLELVLAGGGRGRAARRLE